ncbi:MAG: glycosyltransferase family 4 protein [Planctomycetales bacterium]|nr:glycosyltransferase family 4 protein [Planctomycetales bacterium]MBN8627627.1 glycosyltransferase family 4 protein [Planctomycetota bacterium]
MSNLGEAESPVALVTGDFVRTGGMDRANLALANYLAHAGHNVHLVAHRVAPELTAFPNVCAHFAAKPCNSYFFGQSFLAARGRTVGRQVAASGGRVIVNGGNCCFPDVNWVHYVHAAYQPKSALSLARQIKLHLEHPLNVRREREALRAAQFVICNSRRTQQDVVNKVGVAPEKTHVVYYGNDPKEFYLDDPATRLSIRTRLGLPSDRPLVAFVGALGDRRKGFDVLYSAWRSLKRSPTSEPLLIVIGAGRELDAWRRRSSEEGLDEHVHYLGFRNDVADILRAADLLVAPTRYEAYGLGVQEAICCGMPAIVSATAGVAERYPTELGDLLIADVENAVVLADRLRLVLSDIDSFRRRCVSFGEILRGRTWDDMSREIARFMNLDQIRLSGGQGRQAVLA